MRLKKLPNELIIGLVLSEYRNLNNKDDLINIELVKRIDGWRELEPYVYEDEEVEDKKRLARKKFQKRLRKPRNLVQSPEDKLKPEKENINALDEQWLVRIVSDSPFDNGKELIRWIPRFHSTGLLRIKEPEDDYIDDENDEW